MSRDTCRDNKHVKNRVWTRNEIEPEIPKSRELISIQPNSDLVFREGKEMVSETPPIREIVFGLGMGGSAHF